MASSPSKSRDEKTEKRLARHLKQWHFINEVSELESTQALGGPWTPPNNGNAATGDDVPTSALKPCRVYYRGQCLFTPLIHPTKGWAERTKSLASIGLLTDHAVFFDSKVNEITNWQEFYRSPLRAIAAIRVKAEADFIEPNVYLGDLEAAENEDWLRQVGITHIVRATKMVSSSPMKKGIEYFQCDVDDVNEENILRFFCVTTPFMQKAVSKGGRVLVHCALGRSRSVTLLAAFMLEQRRSQGPPALPAVLQVVSDILRDIAAKRPAASPTRGFVYQLVLWGLMGCSIDGKSPFHRHYKIMNQLGFRRIKQDTAVDKLIYKVFPDSIDVIGSPIDATADTVYQCAQCKCPLFTPANCFDHNLLGQDLCADPSATAAAGSAASSSSSNNNNSGRDRRSSIRERVAMADAGVAALLEKEARVDQVLPALSCRAHHVEPMKWMLETPNRVDRHFEGGQLQCPECRVALGPYSWKPAVCVCGLFLPFHFTLMPAHVVVVGPTKKKAARGSGK